MASSSVYVYFRPLLVMCYMMGQFAAVHVTARSSANLEFCWRSWSVLLYLLGQAVIFCDLAIFAICGVDATTFIKYYHSIMFLMFLLLGLWFLYSTQDIVKVIKDIDALRDTFQLLPVHLRPTLSHPHWFSWVICLAFVVPHLVHLIIMLPFFPNPHMAVHKNSFSIDISFFSPFRQLLILSALSYSCGLVIKDTARAWKHYCSLDYSLNYRPARYVRCFCQLVSEQGDILSRIDNCLKAHILTLLVYRSFDSVNSMFLGIGTPLVRRFISLLSWTLHLVICFNSFVSAKSQYQTLRSEVLDMQTTDLFRTDARKVRLLLDQLNCEMGQFTACGFMEINTYLILYFLAMGFDYFLMYMQNEDLLLQMAILSSSHVNMTSPSTPTPQ